jgi:hypothetical protein
MNKTLKALGAAAALLVATGCAGGPTMVAAGLFSAAKVPHSVGTGTGGAKEGEACAMVILGLVGIGDASITAAKNAGGIKTVSHVDQNNLSILGYIYANTCTRVTGD